MKNKFKVSTHDSTAYKTRTTWDRIGKSTRNLFTSSMTLSFLCIENWNQVIFKAKNLRCWTKQKNPTPTESFRKSKKIVLCTKGKFYKSHCAYRTLWNSSILTNQDIKSFLRVFKNCFNIKYLLSLEVRFMLSYKWLAKNAVWLCFPLLRKSFTMYWKCGVFHLKIQYGCLKRDKWSKKIYL